ncbi:hypothetical protein PENTCL1PPCAC_16993, partial [Pristionchus entomophagus]
SQMVLSPWVVSARIVKFLEGIGGITLNSVLIYFLLRTNLGSAARLYRISCLISRTSTLLFSWLSQTNSKMPLMVGGGFVPTLYGPLLHLIPEKLADLFFVAFLSQAHMMWEMIPAPSILQYLSLYKSESRNSKKLFLAYIIPILLFETINQKYFQDHCLKYIPTVEYRKEIQGVIAELHGAGPKDCRIYGVPKFSKNGEYDLMTMIYFDVFPSYFSSYGLFVFTAIQIREKLRSLGKIVSSKTEIMQRRFFLTQVAQIFLPLVLLSFPTGLVVTSAFLGVDLANFSFLFVYAFWISPSA